MERNDRRTTVPPIGATSLLTVFAVLCLTVFALLTLSDVRSDARLAEASLESVQAYYAADAKAQEILARLRNGEAVDGVTFSGSGLLQADYAVPISDTQELQVSVILKGIADREYAITRWQSVSTTPWQEESNLHLWTPGSQ